MTFGPYEVLESIGAGGMGEVYKARDTRLHRDVAIKVLRSFEADSSTWERFQREARAASSLSHPNICTVHDVGEANGQPYLVMELLEGVTLRVHMGEKALETKSALAIATQIAAALEAAHDKGIVHRDIKPANVMITGSGHVKVLDFSLARKTGSGLGEARIGGKLTLESLSAEGTVAGTPHYLSPEALQGARADVRSDLWALGVVLYQMVSGRLPFTAATTIELSESIIKDPAPPLHSSVPAPVRAIVDRCLRKLPEERYQNAGQVRSALEALPGEGVTRRRWLWGACAASAVAGGGFIWKQRPEIARDPLEGVTPKPLTNFKGDELDGVISPDGKWVAFISNVDGTFDIWTHEVATGDQRLWRKGAYNEGSRNLIRDVGFTADGEIWARPYTIGVAGSGPTEVRPRTQETPPRPFPDTNASELAWSVDGTKMAYIRPKDADSIFVADRTGANPKKLLGNDNNSIHQHALVWSRDGAWIYFTQGVLGRPNKFDIWRISSEGGDPIRLTFQDTELGYPNPIDDRTVLYLAKDEKGAGMWLYALDVQTKDHRRVGSGTDVYLALSGMANPNGRRLVATIAKPSPGLWTVPIPDGRRMAHNSDVTEYPLPKPQLPWAPRFGSEADGGSLYFLSSSGSSGAGLWRYLNHTLTNMWKGSDGALFEPAVVSGVGEKVGIKLLRNGKAVWHVTVADGTFQPVGERLEIEGSATFAPDGKSLLAGGKDAVGPGLYRIPLDGRAPSRLISGDALNPVWSGPANLIVYSSRTEKATRLLHAARHDGTPVEIAKIEVTGPQPVRFLPDGTGLVYLKGTDFWHLDLSPGSIPRRLTQITEATAVEGFDITPDGKNIVFDRLPRNSDIYLIELPPKG
jgi:Tol biopolymer transport system component